MKKNTAAIEQSVRHGPLSRFSHSTANKTKWRRQEYIPQRGEVRATRRASTRKGAPPSRCSSPLGIKTGKRAVANHNLPRSAKIVVSRIPEPQVQRILQRHAKGESIRAISRAEKRSRECVTRIVTSEQAQQLVQSMRAEFYGLADDAIAAVRHTLQSQKDGRLGYKFLMDIGVVPVSGDEGFNAMQVTPLDKALTPLERVSATDDSGRINPLGLVLSRVAEVTAKAYGFSLPTPAEIWRNRTLAALVDEITAGNNQYLDLSNPAEWNRIRDLAEGVLQGKHGMDDQEIVAVRKKYESED